MEQSELRCVQSGEDPFHSGTPTESESESESSSSTRESWLLKAGRSDGGRFGRFHFVPAALRAEKAFVLEWMRRRLEAAPRPRLREEDSVLRDVPPSLRADREVVVGALALCSGSLLQADDAFKRDRELVMMAAAGSPKSPAFISSFEWASADLFSDAELLQEVRRAERRHLSYYEGVPRDTFMSVSYFSVDKVPHYIFRVAMLTGKSCTLLWDSLSMDVAHMRRKAKDLLGIEAGQAALLLLQQQCSGEVVEQEVAGEGEDGGSREGPCVMEDDLGSRQWCTLDEVTHLQLVLCEGYSYDDELGDDYLDLGPGLLFDDENLPPVLLDLPHNRILCRRPT